MKSYEVEVEGCKDWYRSGGVDRDTDLGFANVFPHLGFESFEHLENDDPRLLVIIEDKTRVRESIFTKVSCQSPVYLADIFNVLVPVMG